MWEMLLAVVNAVGGGEAVQARRPQNPEFLWGDRNSVADQDRNTCMFILANERVSQIHR